MPIPYKNNPNPFVQDNTISHDKVRKTFSDKNFAMKVTPAVRKQYQEFTKDHTILIACRVHRRQTSIKIRSTLAALYCLIVGGEKIKDYKLFLMEGVYKAVQHWYGDNGQGLSAFVQDFLVRECLDKSEKDMLDYIICILDEQCTSNPSFAKNS